jgi:carbonic anhydrase
MTRIIRGVLDFQRRVFGRKQSLFRRLAQGQQPQALFITCSDSRINPNLLTQTDPGELFILRNAGNLVPAFGGPPNGEAATVEYAVAHLNVHDLVVCGHSRCGAMQGLLNPAALHDLPGVAGWLEHAREVLVAVQAAGDGLSAEAKLNLAIERNVLVQMEHLKTHPAVAAALAARSLRLHGWVYHLESGEVTAYDPLTDRFVPLLEAMRRQHWLPQPDSRPPDAASEPWVSM